MSKVRVLYHLARADFLERIRRFSFIVMLVAAVYATYIFIPANGATYTTLSFGAYRGTYNSAWIGAQVAMLTSIFLLFFGFYLVKNAIERDRQTRVGQILAATPLSKPTYTLGKMISNFAVLGLMVVVIMLSSLVLQQVRAEDQTIDLVQLALPFAYLLIPTVAVIGAIAVLFEAIPFLSRGFGNIIYYFVAVAALVGDMQGEQSFSGIHTVTNHMKDVCKLAFPDYDMSKFSIGIRVGASDEIQHFDRFIWDGLPITTDFLLERLIWLGIAIVIAVIAASPFDRFCGMPVAGKFTRRLKRRSQTRKDQVQAPEPGSASMDVAQKHHELTPLAGIAAQNRILGTYIAELKLALKGQPIWWYLATLGLIIAGLLTPLNGMRHIVLPMAFIWPTLVWSKLGCREVRDRTHQIIFSAPHPLSRQLPMTWLAGVTVALVVSSGVIMHQLVAGEMNRVAALAVGAMFVPALALALGTWTNSSKMFEISYLIWWYIGPLNAVPMLDYIGVSDLGAKASTTIAYCAVTGVLLIAAYLGRWRQLRM